MSEIWDDEDVRDIVQRVPGGQPDLLLGDLDEPQLQMILHFIEHDERVSASRPPDETLEACLVGIRTVEGFPAELSGTNARGWKKFVIYMTAANVQILWDAYQDDRSSAVGGWVLEALGSVGVEPDGFATALGRAYSSTMSIHGSGAIRDERTGTYVVRGGGDGRRLAGIDRGVA